MRRIIDNDLLTVVVRLIIGSAFIYASVYKIIEPADFAKSIWYYHLVPGWGINLMAIYLPWIEFIAGAAVILGIYRRGASLLVLMMLIVFLGALSSTVVRGIDIDCGCFKAAQSATHSAWSSILLDIGLLVLSIQLLLSRSRCWMIKPD